MRLSRSEVRARAAAFADGWQEAAYEKGETQSFYNAFFEVFGVRRRSVSPKCVAEVSRATRRMSRSWTITLVS